MGSKKIERETQALDSPGRAGNPPWVLLGGMLIVAALAAVALYPTSASEPNASIAEAESTPAPAATTADSEAATPARLASATTPAEPEPQAAVASSPRPAPDAPMPPLPLIPSGMPRPPEVISEAFRFAARNPDILEFVPCFCGCETAGHRSNAHCFVRSRNPDGSVKEWETHGMGCAICLDVARDSMQLRASGASVRDVRSAIETKYASRFPRMTPTPEPPQ